MNLHFMMMFIICKNWLGAFTSPNSKTCHDYKSNLVVKTVWCLLAVAM